MIDSARLERNLIAAARRYAPTLIPAGWQKAGDYSGSLPNLARALATYNVLVMAGDAPQASVKGWTDGYQGFYRVLCEALFPSFGRVSAFYLDQEQPLMVALYGEATPVIVALAGFVTPYVVARQGTRPLEVELVGMMDMILEELEATDLPREEYRRLRDSGASILRGLLDSEVRQFALTPPARPIFDEMNAQRPVESRSVPVVQRAAPPQPADLPEPPLPPDLPEYIPPPPVSAPETLPEPGRRFDPDAVPIFFNPGQRGNNSSVPPVPPLPRRD
ncbi:MAG: hypothetical protein ABI835_01625 [Chloroflexota bacterium]